MDDLQIATDVPLARYSTMRLGGRAAYAVAVTTLEQAADAWHWASSRDLPYLMVGSGSNIVWRDEGFPGLLILNKIMGYETVSEDDDRATLAIGAGENWDKAVARSVEAGLSGIEALSLVPGTTGATPVQNVGAYGQDISQTLVSVQAFDTQARQPVSIPGDECAFGYRTSRFKTYDRGRFLITGITLQLTKNKPRPPFYAALQKYLDERQITDYSPAVIRQAVIDIRSSKLPDPNQVANNGSFFANPIIDLAVFESLAKQYPDMPHWPVGDPAKTKIPAAWLLEQAGFKAIHDEKTGMATWDKQPLVMVNEHARTTADLLEFRQKITDTVKDTFGIELEQEPELLPVW